MKRSKITFILKAALFWLTMLSCTFYTLGIENLIEVEYWEAVLLGIAINFALIYLCWRYLSYEEVCKVSGSKTFEKIIEENYDNSTRERRAEREN